MSQKCTFTACMNWCLTLVIINANYLMTLAALQFPSFCRTLGSVLSQACEWISHLSILTLIVNV